MVNRFHGRVADSPAPTRPADSGPDRVPSPSAADPGLVGSDLAPTCSASLPSASQSHSLLSSLTQVPLKPPSPPSFRLLPPFLTTSESLSPSCHSLRVTASHFVLPSSLPALPPSHPPSSPSPPSLVCLNHFCHPIFQSPLWSSRARVRLGVVFAATRAFRVWSCPSRRYFLF